MKLILNCPDERLTPEILARWAAKAKSSVALKVMIGTLDPREDAEIIAVIGTVSGSKISALKDEHT